MPLLPQTVTLANRRRALHVSHHQCRRPRRQTRRLNLSTTYPFSARTDGRYATMLRSSRDLAQGGAMTLSVPGSHTDTLASRRAIPTSGCPRPRQKRRTEHQPRRDRELVCRVIPRLAGDAIRRIPNFIGRNHRRQARAIAGTSDILSAPRRVQIPLLRERIRSGSGIERTATDRSPTQSAPILVIPAQLSHCRVRSFPLTSCTRGVTIRRAVTDVPPPFDPRSRQRWSRQHRGATAPDLLVRPA